MSFERGIAWALGVGATVFVLLLGGLFSGALTDDPPAVNPYASGDSGDEGDVFDTDAYDTGDDGSDDAAATTAAPESTEAPAADDSPLEILIEGFAFSGASTASVGQTVIVTNQDGASHTWTDSGGAFDSGTLSGGGGTFEFTFDTAGTFDFFCAIHPTMTGTITVQG